MSLDAVSAYVRETKEFFEDYVGLLENEKAHLPGITDASRILLWITTIAETNARAALEKLKILERDLPQVIQFRTAGDFVSGTTSSPKENESLVGKLNKTISKTTSQLHRASQMIDLQVKIAQSRVYSLSVNTGGEQLDAIERLQDSCDAILEKNKKLGTFAQNKSWFNADVFLGSVLFRIKHISNGMFKKSSERRRDAVRDISTQARNDLKMLAQEASRVTENLRLTNNSRKLLDCFTDTDISKPGSKHYEHIPASVKYQVNSFVQYMQVTKSISKDGVLKAIKPLSEGSTARTPKRSRPGR